MNTHLNSISIFQTLNDEERQCIVPIIQQRTYKQGSHLFFQDEQVTAFYFVTTGKIKVYKVDSLGKEQIVNFFDNGDMFPHVGFFQKGTYPANAFAVEDSELFSFYISFTPINTI